MDGAGIAAVLRLGASAAQNGDGVHRLSRVGRGSRLSSRTGKRGGRITR